MTLSTTKPKALASYLSHAAARAKLLLCTHDYRQGYTLQWDGDRPLRVDIYRFWTLFYGESFASYIIREIKIRR